MLTHYKADIYNSSPFVTGKEALSLMPRPRPTFVDYGRVRRQLSVSPATFRAMITAGTFPPPILLRAHKKVFLVKELDAWFKVHRSGQFPLEMPEPPTWTAS